MIYCVVMERGFEPKKNKTDDAGWDIFIPEDISLHSWTSGTLMSQVKILLPLGWSGLIRPRGSAYINKDISTNGTIDRFTGEIKLKFDNLSNVHKTFERGTALCQLIGVYTGAGVEPHTLTDLPKVVKLMTACNDLMVVEELPKTARGTDGFGSSGNTGGSK